jgi:isopenicillin N synthase-like dioxygenase
MLENSFVVNIGDMFDRLTSGRYRSRPHRVLRPDPGHKPRFSFPLFFDFAWDAMMEPLSLSHLPALSDEETRSAEERWGKTTFREAKGFWSQYLARKVQKVFPHLDLPNFEPNAAPSTRFTRVVAE